MTEIHRLLVATTAHVTRHEASILDAHGYSRGEYGWFLYVGGKGRPVVPEIPEPSKGLAGAIRAARRRSCGYLLLDRDADCLRGVPVYEWG